MNHLRIDDEWPVAPPPKCLQPLAPAGVPGEDGDESGNDRQVSSGGEGSWAVELKSAISKNKLDWTVNTPSFHHQAHESVSAFAKAYALGEKESAAAVNLLQHIPPNVKEALTELVRTLGTKP